MIQERIELPSTPPLPRPYREFNHWKSQPSRPAVWRPAGSQIPVPDLVTTSLYAEVEKMRRNIWLELNSYLTALEQTNVITTFSIIIITSKAPKSITASPTNFLITRCSIPARNAIANAFIIDTGRIARRAIRAINIPRQLSWLILTWITLAAAPNPAHKIQFYIDPMTGHVLPQKTWKLFQAHLRAAHRLYFKP